MGIATLNPSYDVPWCYQFPVGRIGRSDTHQTRMRCRLPCVRLPSAYLIAANASTCNSKSGLDNCGARIVVLFGEGGPK
jgi:hypothetical protein